MQPSCSSLFSSHLNKNLNKPQSTSPGGGGGKKEHDSALNVNLNFKNQKEFEPSNLLRIKSNRLGSSAPNLCSSMVNINFVFEINQSINQWRQQKNLI